MNSLRAHLIAVGIAALSLFPGACADSLLFDVLQAVMGASNATIAALKSVDVYPYQGNANGAPGWRTTDFTSWQSGFLPGTLWTLFNAMTQTCDPSAAWWMEQAAARTAPIAPAASFNTTHDLMFIVGIPFIQQYALTANLTARSIALRAADSLSARFVPKIGAIRSWGMPNKQHTMQVIVGKFTAAQ